MELYNYRIRDIRAIMEHEIMKGSKTTDVTVRSLHFDDEDYFECDDTDFDAIETHIYADVEVDGICHRWLFVWSDNQEEFTTLMDMDQKNDDKANPIPTGRKFEDGPFLGKDLLPENELEHNEYVGQSIADDELNEEVLAYADKNLPIEVTHIRFNYPFEVERGTYNVYKIETAKTWRELIQQIQQVVRHEYEAGKCIAPHALEDFVIEPVIVHPGNLATVGIGS